MRKMLFTMLIGLCAVCAHAEDNSGRKSTENTLVTAAEATSILFVGVKPYNVSSNYYTKDRLAEYFEVSESEVEKYFNGLFCEVFSEIAGKQDLSITACDESQTPVLSLLNYEMRDGVLYSELSDTGDTYRRALELSGAGYLLVCDQYRINKEDHPYENFAHILHYSLFDTTGRKVYDGHYQYASLDLGNVDMLEKQLRKAAGRFVKAIL